MQGAHVAGTGPGSDPRAEEISGCEIRYHSRLNHSYDSVTAIPLRWARAYSAQRLVRKIIHVDMDGAP
jgi:hypothetical protein